MYWVSDVCSSDLRPGLQIEGQYLLRDDLVSEPARNVPARVMARHPVALPPPEPEGEGAVADASLRFIFGEEFLDRRAAVGALIIALRAQPVAPVDTLAVERDAQAEPDRIGVAAAVRCAEIGRESCRERVCQYV